MEARGLHLDNIGCPNEAEGGIHHSSHSYSCPKWEWRTVMWPTEPPNVTDQVPWACVEGVMASTLLL